MPLEIAPRIVLDPDFRFGKPIIKGTRVPVELELYAPFDPPVTKQKMCETLGCAEIATKLNPR